MGAIRIVMGSGHGPTPTAAYDAALAEAGVHNYNLVTLSSVIPADARIERVGTAPDLGPAGRGLYVVQAAETTDEGEAAAAIGWTREPDGPGIFYEVSGSSERRVREDVRAGLSAGRELREWDFGEKHVEVTTATAAEEYACAIVLAVYGESHTLIEQ
ncbi:pyruvoyl-dependent arginine decarboxylase [Halorhabdus sp. BNX81]|uniref:pyruvoyl-dependent arginine decarboxylase n=1 Tax=Halorhabdus sp. BNX81 TaxID=2980181 RepID=UPI0023DD1828|nr:pyruvoyl-dependent arginine decarboxylase [Halorhabdus sp. BNX81]WEL21016.1 Pyruvoyl-dependent arginine decarboxylase [Halorhabdus sp. BNX81]